MPLFRYINPFWLVLATSLVSALYAYLFVRESVQPDPSAKLFSTRNHKAVWRLYSTGGSISEGGGRFHRCKLWLYTLCFFLVVTVHSGSRELYVLYELSSPLCWGPVLIGYGSAAQHLAYLSSLLGLKIMQRCLEESWVALVGLASNISGLVVFSVADTTQLMFTGERLWSELMTSSCFVKKSFLRNSIWVVENMVFRLKGFVFIKKKKKEVRNNTSEMTSESNYPTIKHRNRYLYKHY